MVGVRLNAITGEILWYTLGFFHFSRQPQCGICRDEGRLIQCPAEFSSQQSLQPPHCSRIVRHLLRESLVDEGRQPQIFRRQPLQPEAEPDDGLLDVLVVEKVSLLQVASVIGHYQKGRYAEYPELIRHARCRSLRIECAERSVVNVDGEAVYTTDAKIEVVPHAIRFFYPKGLSYHAKNSQSGHKFAEITP